MTTTTAIYLWNGFVRPHSGLTDEELAHYGGDIGAASAIAGWAERLDACIPLFVMLDPEGCFEYEAVEAVGTMLRGQHAVVSDATIGAAASIIARWFHPRDLAERIALHHACHKAMKAGKTMAVLALNDCIGAINALSGQIEQMRAMFPDTDGTIAEAMEAGVEATCSARDALAGTPL